MSTKGGSGGGGNVTQRVKAVWSCLGLMFSFCNYLASKLRAECVESCMDE